MDRKEFLSAVGVSAAAFTVMNCLACSKGSSPGSSGSVNGPTGVDFTLDLTAAANSALLTNGGYMAINGVLVAKSTTGLYIAVQQSCTHQSYPLIYDGSGKQFYCNNHGSAFSEAGVVKNSPANRNLTVYHTTLTNTSLRVYS